MTAGKCYPSEYDITGDLLPGGTKSKGVQNLGGYVFTVTPPWKIMNASLRTRMPLIHILVCYFIYMYSATHTTVLAVLNELVKAYNSIVYKLV